MARKKEEEEKKITKILFSLLSALHRILFLFPLQKGISNDKSCISMRNVALKFHTCEIEMELEKLFKLRKTRSVQWRRNYLCVLSLDQFLFGSFFWIKIISISFYRAKRGGDAVCCICARFINRAIASRATWSRCYFDTYRSLAAIR